MTKSTLPASERRKTREGLNLSHHSSIGRRNCLFFFLVESERICSRTYEENSSKIGAEMSARDLLRIQKPHKGARVMADTDVGVRFGVGCVCSDIVLRRN